MKPNIASPRNIFRFNSSTAMRYQNFIKYKMKRFLGYHRREANIAMLHFGRCGSTVLSSLLNQHRNIQWDSEIFEGWYKKKAVPALSLTNSPEKLIKMRMSARKIPYFGFETKAYPEEHLRKESINLSIKEYVDLLKHLGFRYFIFLKRNNYLQQAISGEMGHKTKTWHLQSNSNRKLERKKFSLNIDSIQFGNSKLPLINIFEKLDIYSDETLNHLSTLNSLNLAYEDDIQNNPKDAYLKVCKFLSIKPIDVAIKYKKTNPGSVRDKLENIDEVSGMLKNTKYEWMLDS